jgi:DnaK suppressor protein
MGVDEKSLRRVLQADAADATARRDELLRDLQAVVEASRDVATDDEHDPEGATIAYERAKTTALMRQAEDRLADIQRALSRLAAGEYMTCDRCGRDIGEARLQARPTATTCVACSSSKTKID